MPRRPSPKPVPWMVIWDPGGPAGGSMRVMLVPTLTVKGGLWASPAWETRTTKDPDCAPVGTITPSVVGVAVRTITGRSPRKTMFSAMRAEKFSPTRVTSAPGGAEEGSTRLI